VLGLLALDYLLAHRQEFAKHLMAASATLIVILLAFSPLLWAFFFRLAVDRSILRPAFSIAATTLFGAYNLYTLFVSESVAPWFWYLSLPALLAIGLCALLLARHGPPPARRMFFGFLVCMLVMTLLNLINTKRLLFLSPWLLIPLAVMLAGLPTTSLRKWAAMALGFTGAVGWFGILSRHYYAAPRLIEPWPSVASAVAGDVRKGAVVIGNNPSFFFYLTDAIRSSGSDASRGFAGMYPVCMRHPQLFNPNQWLEAGGVFAPTTLLVKGAADETLWASTVAAEKVLDQACHLEGVRRELPDSGFAWKQRWFASAGQPAWRIEVRTYGCPGADGGAVRARLGSGG
jgi:hypothetical protein